jgi:hypothetical protein
VTSRPADKYPVTPDGRYFVVRGRLWRRSNPKLTEYERQSYVSDLMSARREVGAGLQSGDGAAVREARARVDKAKRQLGERGPVWWSDDAPDLNRHMVCKTDYADWFAQTADNQT